MSAERLLALQDERAFDPVPPQHDLHDLHVPFDQLLDGQPRWEADLDAALRRGERVAVVGGSGSGKTSLVAYVLRPTAEVLAPIPIPVALTDPVTMTDPAKFAAHLVALVRRYIDTAVPRAALTASTTSPRVRPARRRYSVAPEWMGARVELAYEMQSVAEPGGVVDHVETARTLVDLIAAHGLRAVLVLDDTDKWIRGPGGDPDAERRDAFFRRIVRFIAEHIGCAAVVAVHPAYLTDPGFRAAAGFLSSTITVPALPGAGAIEAVLAHRQHIAEVSADLPPEPLVWSAAAVEDLHARYAATALPNLRSALYLAHTTLAAACSNQADTIEPGHVQLAARDLVL